MDLVKIIHREQWDFEKDIELQIVQLRDNNYTMCLEHTKKEKWQYCDDHFPTLKIAHECFDKTMEKRLLTTKVE